MIEIYDFSSLFALQVRLLLDLTYHLVPVSASILFSAACGVDDGSGIIDTIE